MTDPTKALTTIQPTPDLILREVVPASRHPATVYLSRLSRGSRRTMAQALDTVSSFVTGEPSQAMRWWDLRYQHTNAIRAVLEERYKPATVNKMLSALRQVLKECWRLGYMTAEDYQRAADVANVRAHTLPKGRALSAGELRALFDACAEDQGPAGTRDAAIIALLYGAGLRRSEVVALNVDDYDPETGELTIRQAKGRKDRITYATNGAGEALADWLALRGDEPGPLIWPINKAGTLHPRRMTDQAILHILHKRAEHARVQAFSPHDLRRTFISHLLEAGADIATVQKLAGHAQVTTTARYDRRGEKAKREASHRLNVPYRRSRTATAPAVPSARQE